MVSSISRVFLSKDHGSTYKRVRVKGINKLRRTINRLEQEEREVIQKALYRAARDIQKDAIGIATLKNIRLTGEMIESISIKRSRDKLSAVIGPGADRITQLKNNPWNTSGFTGKRSDTVIKNNEAQWNMMKAWWAEFGTGPPVPQDPRPFMNPAWEENKDKFTRHVRAAVKRTLRKVSRESSD